MKPLRIYHEDGQLWQEVWRIDEKRHRLDGPAYRTWDQDGQLMFESWYIGGKRHRLDGPAYQQWSENGQLLYEGWWIGGKLHRIDGPAWQLWHQNGQPKHKAWGIDGKEVEPIEGPLKWALFIAKKFGNVHGLEKFISDNIEGKKAKAILASVKLL